MSVLTIPVEQKARQSFSLKEWLNGQSKYGTLLMEEPITRLMVLKVNLGAIVMLAAIMLTGLIE